nr:hypothetical protein [Candidatus Sigynarchaeota archaeon]
MLGILSLLVRAVPAIATTSAEQYYPQAGDVLNYNITITVMHRNGSFTHGPFWLVNANEEYSLWFRAEDIDAPDAIVARCGAIVMREIYKPFANHTGWLQFTQKCILFNDNGSVVVEAPGTISISDKGMKFVEPYAGIQSATSRACYRLEYPNIVHLTASFIYNNISNGYLFNDSRDALCGFNTSIDPDGNFVVTSENEPGIRFLYNEGGQLFRQELRESYALIPDSAILLLRLVAELASAADNGTPGTFSTLYILGAAGIVFLCCPVFAHAWFRRRRNAPGRY